MDKFCSVNIHRISADAQKSVAVRTLNSPWQRLSVKWQTVNSFIARLPPQIDSLQVELLLFDQTAEKTNRFGDTRSFRLL